MNAARQQGEDHPMEQVMATDWDSCPAVERDPGKMSGALVFRGTRLPVSSLFESLKNGATIDEFMDWYPGATREQIDAVIDHETREMEAPVVREMGL